MMDAITLEIYRHRFNGIAEEMGLTLKRTAYSPNIKEREDFSCAIFYGTGKLVAQAAHIPVHLGAMPDCIEKTLAAIDVWQENDVVILNDPFEGGTHLPDITMVSPVFLDSDLPDFFVASRAHHADIGGMTPGSLPLSTEIFQEGLIIPPVKIHQQGVPNESLLKLILRNVRTPDERKGDLSAQLAAHATGERRIHDLCEKYGKKEITAYATNLQNYSERMATAAISSWPDGSAVAEDFLEFVDQDELKLIRIIVKITKADDKICFDFAGSDKQGMHALNAVRSITKSACYYVVRCLLDDDIPDNDGCFRNVEIITEKESLLDASAPHAVAAGNVETSQRIVDVLLLALHKLMPDKIPAASQGSMNNLLIGGTKPNGKAFSYYETIAGGTGAGAHKDGLSGVHSHMTNTLNTPVEALEMNYPFRIKRYQLRGGSGGEGKHRGGEGVIREYEILLPCTITMLSERRETAPWGLCGGENGKVGRNILITTEQEEIILPSKFSRGFKAGECLRIETPGGGGYGDF